jgi:hypothetical protein
MANYRCGSFRPRRRESTSFHPIPADLGVTIMGLVEFHSGLISDAELLPFKSHSFTRYEVESTHGS